MFINDKTFVTPVVKGGLGNQLFQVAAAFNYAAINNFSLCLPEASIIHFHNQQYRANGNPINKYRNNVFRTFEFQNVSSVIKYKYNEPKFSYSPIPLANGSLAIEGYFQSERYFHESRIDIVKRFTPTSQTLELILERYPTIGLKSSTVVHIRRGDLKHVKSVSPMLEYSYYRKALAETGTDGDIFVFTDEVDFDLAKFVSQTGFLKRRYIRVRFSEDYQELWAISLAKNIIIANSTFSWWGAYLATPDANIFRPSLWFGRDGPNDTQDLFPARWNEVRVEYVGDKFY